MGRRYTNEEKARVRYLLELSDWNVRRTAADTGVPRETIANWKRLWQNGGTPEAIENIAVEIATDYIADAEYVRDAALRRLRQRVDDPEITTKDLYTMYGILTDKIDRAKGLVTKNQKVVVEMPDLKELGTQLGTFLAGALSAAQQRQGEIIEAEVIGEYSEPSELPASTT